MLSLALCGFALPGAVLPVAVFAQADLRVALPAGGEVQVENGRGSVRVEVWGEAYVSVSATVEGAPPARKAAPRNTKAARTPVRIERSERLLSVVAARDFGTPQTRVHLDLRVPRETRLRVFGTSESVEVRGLPASLSAQTTSGDIRVALPSPPDADLTAHSLSGAVAFEGGLTDGSQAAQVLRQKFQARLGAGGRVVRLFSGRGRITIVGGETLAGATAAPQTALQQSNSTRSTPVPTPDTTPGRAPRLIGSDNVARQDAGADARRPPVLTGGSRVSADSNVRASATPAARTAEDAPQEVGEDEVVRVESELVTLNVSVVDRASGRGLVGLVGRDFKLYEDGAEQQIEHFESSSAPFDLLLLIDLSGSTARVTSLIRSAALRFVNAARPQDRIGIVTFAGTTSIASPLTTDREALRSAVSKMEPPQGDTKLYDALDTAMGYLDKEAAASRRRAVVLMSDGLDSTLPNVTGVGSTVSYEELRRRVQEFDGVVYTVWTSTEYEAFSPEDIQPETFDLVHDRMFELSQEGGGAFYEVNRLEDLAGAYERVVADLGTLYSLSYRPSNRERDGRWRKILVKLPRHPEAVARGKRGYYAK